MNQLMTPHHLKPLAPRQRELLDFIVKRQRAGVTPTVREMAEAIGSKSPNLIQGILLALEKKGYITRTRALHRDLTVLDTGQAETLWGSFPI